MWWVSFHTFLYKYKNHTHFPLIKNQSRVELETHLQIAYIAHCKWWDEVREEGSSLYIQNPYRISFANSIIIGKSLLTECNRSTIHVFKSSHVVNDIDIKSHLATSLLGSSKQIQKDRKFYWGETGCWVVIPVYGRLDRW